MPPKKPVQKATVIKSACGHQIQTTTRADVNVLDKIQKCLNRAYHANASEAEAKTALFISQKLMSDHNVNQADLMANDERSNKASYGGRSIVRIEKVAGLSRRVVKEAFVEIVAKAMCTFFDCKSFSTDFGISVEWSFFGIASNTVAAAVAFEMAHNLILEWACAYKGGTPTFSYRLGVSDGLRTMANREKQKELAEVQHKELRLVTTRNREETKEHQRELDRAATMSTEAKTASDYDEDTILMKVESDNESDSDSNDMDGLNIKADFSMDDVQIIDLCDDVDETIERYMKREPSEPPNPNGISESWTELDMKVEHETVYPTPMASCWKSQMQLIHFRATSEQVADEYLAQHKIKLHNGKKRTSTIRDINSYRRGQQDSSRINVRQKTLA
ncbi:hypothetical protein N7448_011117 [Penicillium atrosanguineum]|uniref:DUF2786 domain-containing protein n=1 Tax=Penicillium atrosanguineum TaxID=1132637 RepID=A0A9W9KS10_9EURO|nr:hypothetical protein N7448_011117 [Penicillium atrosanguineum]KAJ5318276.1 hypothetical protein N7476_004696 [Penicillium atrosanguineum]